MVKVSNQIVQRKSVYHIAAMCWTLYVLPLIFCWCQPFKCRFITFIFIWFIFWMQMAFLRVDFKFKQQYQHAWISCIALTISVFCLTLISYHNYSLFGSPSSLKFFGFCILQNIILTTSLLSFIILMHNLRKRYNMLNSFLRLFT